jgi:hypothetical protein
MVAKYNGQLYIANKVNDKIYIITKFKDKAIDGFQTKHNDFYKQIKIDDERLTDLYDVHFFVDYNDSIEKETFWCIDENRPIGLIALIENDEATITIDHFALDDSWITYDKYAASKIININDCFGWYIYKTYYKKNGNCFNDIYKEKQNVTIKELKENIIKYRYKNI